MWWKTLCVLCDLCASVVMFGEESTTETLKTQRETVLSISSKLFAIAFEVAFHFAQTIAAKLLAQRAS